MIEALLLWWDRLWCKHHWRPALSSKKPAKVCVDCMTVIQLTDEEFYAQFGNIAGTAQVRGK